MSEELKRKLYNYEVEPPEPVWSRIATTLDLEINAEFPQKLHALEATPPYEVWNRIEEQLEEGSKEQYRDKLYNLEVTPPARAWNKILTLLDEEKTLPKISSKGKIISFVRYAAAACIIGVLAVGAFRLLNDNRSVAVKTVLPRINPSAPVPQNPPQQQVPAPSNNLPRERSVLAQVTNKPRKKTLPESMYMTQTAVNFPAAGSTKSMSDFRQASLKGDIPGNCSLISEADPYLMFVNPDGYLIRISKKLAETLGCAYTNENSDEYHRCQEQIKKWRDKIAQSPATSSPDNFMDVLNVIKTVQE